MDLPARLPRLPGVILGVLLLHGAALWGIQNGLIQRPLNPVLDVDLVSVWPEPAAASRQSLNEQTPARDSTTARTPLPTPARTPSAAAPSALPNPTTSAIPPVLPAAGVTPANPGVAVAPATVSGTVTREASPAATTSGSAMPPAAAGAASPALGRTELPSSDAAYLDNPKPAYPAISRRLGEQGKVLVRVLISAEGAAQKAEIQQSSGFDRLDQAAVTTVLRWRFVPGKRGGVPEAMWVTVPIQFVLD